MELSSHAFIGIDERKMPSRNRWKINLCQSAGFRPRFEHVINDFTQVRARAAS